MRSLLLVAALGLGLITPAAASAQTPEDPPPDVPQTELRIGDLRTDVQATHAHAPVTCVTPTGTAGACVLTLKVSWQRTPKTKWAPSGPTTVVEQRQLTIPAGATQDVATDVPAAKLRDVLSRDDAAAILSYDFADPAGPVDGAAVFVHPPSRKGGCGGEVFMPVLSGTLAEKTEVNRKDRWDGLQGSQIARSTWYRVTSKRAVVRYSGVRVTAPRGTEFEIGCGGLSDYGGGRFFPLVMLMKGQVRLQGKPTGKATYAAAVDTLEGNLGMRRRERVDMTVTRNPHRFVSTMHVRRGRSGQITPTFHTAKSSPCTNGSKLAVNLQGHITRVR